MKEIIYNVCLSDKYQFVKYLNWFEGMFDSLQIDNIGKGLIIYFPGGRVVIFGEPCSNSFKVSIRVFYSITSVKNGIIDDIRFINLLLINHGSNC